jgi:hypothetical protein
LGLLFFHFRIIHYHPESRILLIIVNFDTKKHIILAKVGYYPLDHIVLGVIRQVRLQNWVACDDLDFDTTILRCPIEEI